MFPAKLVSRHTAPVFCSPMGTPIEGQVMQYRKQISRLSSRIGFEKGKTQYRMDQAKRCIRSAKVLAEDEDYKGAANRFYYLFSTVCVAFLR